MRLTLKMKSQDASTSSKEPPAKKQRFTVGPAASREQTTEDIARHVLELQNEWAKSDRDRTSTHIKALLLATRSDRVSILEGASADCMNKIYAKYPCFQESMYVSIFLRIPF